MKKITRITFALLMCLCMIFALVACKDPVVEPNETPNEPNVEQPSEEQKQPSNEQEKPGDKQPTIVELKPANQNYKGEEVDYSVYFETDGNGMITDLSNYAIQKKDSIIQLEIPKKIGDEEITALSLNFDALQYLRSLTIPENIETIEESVNYSNISLVIYCEATEKPDGWIENWHIKIEDDGDDDDTNFIFGAVVWDCKNNNVSSDGKTYCITPNGMIYALKDDKAELYFSGIDDVESLDLTNILKYNGKTYPLCDIVAYAFTSHLADDAGYKLNNTNLKGVKLPNTMTSIGTAAFAVCMNLTSIEIPSSVTSIGYSAFTYCINLESVTFSENSQLTSIGEAAFESCGSLTSIAFGANSKLTTIGEHAFSDCDSLTSIELPSTVESIGLSAFAYSGLTSIEIPSSVTSIGQGAFGQCYSLESVTFGENSQLTNTGDNVFSSCSDLTSIKLPNSLTKIGINVFSGCSSLESIVIPSNVTFIGQGAFRGCSSLKSVTFENTNDWRWTYNNGGWRSEKLDVTDPSTNATSLTSDNNYYWQKIA